MINRKFGVVISLSAFLFLLLIGDSKFCLGLAQEEIESIECVLPHYFLCENGNCIPESHICDGEYDCGNPDHSDEDPALCSQHFCNQTTEFKCASGRCVPKESRCDRVSQCRDRSDEKDCVYEPCPAGKFSCANHSQCLDMSDVCDNVVDCQDGLASDELHPDPCPANVTCPSFAFKCKTTNVCALPNWLCDNSNDCGDNSDEDPEACKNFKCPDGWFRCNDNRCIPESAVCNGVIDCHDGNASDERHPSPCPKNVTCPAGFFSCEETNICAHTHWLCDGANDCGDNSDENVERCKNTPCPDEWFRCNSQRCIPPTWRCDHSDDCPSGEDEEECDAYFSSLYTSENGTDKASIASTPPLYGISGEEDEGEDDGESNEGDDDRPPIGNSRRKTILLNSTTPLTKQTFNSNNVATQANKQKVNPITSYVNNSRTDLLKQSSNYANNKSPSL